MWVLRADGLECWEQDSDECSGCGSRDIEPIYDGCCQWGCNACGACWGALWDNLLDRELLPVRCEYPTGCTHGGKQCSCYDEAA